ncbi:hypothetical protein M9H77_27892 [Catharanthus roseus]|uniref:Uncharacterized protein n=1 Tax=Catharanthus roseus TaxID=4058 RepID=A0ACC0AFX7_CATRO|nr:hypothetical protein M9H77_27892 [Catharanthus roseus]
MALCVLETLGAKIGDLLIAKGIYLYGVGDQVQQLETKLDQIRRVLEDVNTQQTEHHRSRDCIFELRDLGYEADDRGGGIMENLKRYACIAREGRTRHELGSEIQNLISRISNFVNRFQGFGVRKMMEEEGSKSRQLQGLRRTYAYFTEEDNLIIGLDDDVDLLVCNLVSEEYPLVSVCGMGGLGKTTPAKKVYNHHDVRRHFQGYAGVVCNKDVTMVVNNKVFLHEPRVLTETEGWELLKHKVLKDLQENTLWKLRCKTTSIVKHRKACWNL